MKLKLKWTKVNDDGIGDYYSLRDNYDNEIAYMWYFDKHWSLIPVLYKEILKKKIYFNYKENDLKEVEFRAVLDIMSNLNEIGTNCFAYSDAISNYIADYLKGINNED